MRRRGDILIVDDEDVVLQGTRKILTAEGLIVDTVPGADAAVARLRDNGYRLVLSDLLLPGIDGIELMLALHRRHLKLPVVIVTGFATLDRALESFRNGAFDFLPKPFDAAELMGIVRRGLGYADWTASTHSDPAPDRLADAVETYGLGQHTEVELESEGKARVRLGGTFADLGSDLVSVVLPEPGDEVRQGGECARIQAQGELVHRVWAPLSGRVLGALRIAGRDLRRLRGTRLFDMQPTDPAQELRNLTHHRPKSGPGAVHPKEATW